MLITPTQGLQDNKAAYVPNTKNSPSDFHNQQPTKPTTNYHYHIDLDFSFKLLLWTFYLNYVLLSEPLQFRNSVIQLYFTELYLFI